MASTDEALLRSSWRRAAGHSPAADVALASVLSRYREPHRQYHTLAHLTAVVRLVESLLGGAPSEPTAGAGAGDPDAVRLAAFFHDAVYDPRSSTNEADSAALARRVLAELDIPPDRVERVARLVLATARDGSPALGDTPAVADVAVLLDADLAVLGADPAGYESYARGVRAEYAHVDDDAWRSGRGAVLRGLLSRDPLYRTATLRASHEQRARANLTAELAGLEHPPPFSAAVSP